MFASRLMRFSIPTLITCTKKIPGYHYNDAWHCSHFSNFSQQERKEPILAEEETQKKIQLDTNDDLCTICQQPGDLVLCDKCPQAYHSDCIPSIENPHELPTFKCEVSVSKLLPLPC